MKSKVYVTKRFGFEAAHHLPYYGGKCRSIHGHSYKLEVTISAERNFEDRLSQSPYEHMVIDFSTLKAVVNAEVVNRYDHTNLNEFFAMPTAEGMVVKMFNDLNAVISATYGENGVKLEEVKLWETEDCFASYRGEVF